MNLHGHFLASSYSLMAISFFMLIATGRCDAVTSLLFCVVLIAGWMIDTGKLAWGGVRRWSNWIMFGFLLFGIVEWKMLGMDPVRVTIHVTLFATSLKLLRLKNPRDWLLIYLVSFFLTLLAAGISANALFLFLLVLYLFAGLSTLISYEIRHTQMTFAMAYQERNPGTTVHFNADFWKKTRAERVKRSAPTGNNLLLVSMLTLVAILLLALPIFLVMPRFPRAGGRQGYLNTETLTGFSDTVRLGEVAQIKQNPQVVMRVRVASLSRDPLRNLRWRGNTLNYYDGQSWSESERDPMPIRRVETGFKLEERNQRRSMALQRFFLEPISTNVVFAAPRPIYITGLRELSRDRGDGLWTEDHSYFKLDYTVYSDVHMPTDEELAADNSRDFPREIEQRYLQLPHDHDPRISELAAQLTKGAGTQIEAARRIEQHLRTTYAYSLDLRRVEAGDPVADFLFNVKAGHCEYFASAMVLMLRTRRIPARMVIGFQKGEYNQTVDVYTVRQSDAHAWVEAYFPNNGWVMFEPTASAGLNDYGDDLLSMFRQYGEAMEMFWLEHVIGFDAGHQFTIANAARNWLATKQLEWNWLARWRLTEMGADFFSRLEIFPKRRALPPGTVATPEKTPEESPGNSRTLLWALSAALVLGGLVFAFQRYRSSWRRTHKQNSAASAIAFYQEMLTRLERAGHKRESHQTPEEFAIQLNIPAVTEITQLYQQARFGNQPLSDEQIALVGARLRDLTLSRKKIAPASGVAAKAG